jgi:hypothetical protein
MNRKRQASAAIDEQIAAYERQLRQQLVFDEELADLAARQQAERSRRRMLPVLPLATYATPPPDLHA